MGQKEMAAANKYVQNDDEKSDFRGKSKAFESQNFYSRTFSKLIKMKKAPEYIAKEPRVEIAKSPNCSSTELFPPSSKWVYFAPVCPFVWLVFLAKPKIFQLHWSVDFVLGKKKLLRLWICILSCHLAKTIYYFTCTLIASECLLRHPLTYNRLEVTILNRSSRNFTNCWSWWIDRLHLIFEVKMAKGHHIPKGQQLLKFLKSSIFTRLISNLKRIWRRFHWILEVIIGQKVNIRQKVKMGQVSKILIMHPINFTFKERLHTTSTRAKLHQHQLVRFLRSKCQKDITVQKVNNFLISKILNFHPIDCNIIELFIHWIVTPDTEVGFVFPLSAHLIGFPCKIEDFSNDISRSTLF